MRAHDGTVAVHPPMDRIWEAHDQVIVVCEDDDRVIFTGWIPRAEGTHQPIDVPAPIPERILVTGWNPQALVILRELDPFAAPGTTVDLLVDQDLAGDGFLPATIDELLELTNLQVSLTLAKIDFDALSAGGRRTPATTTWSSSATAARSPPAKPTRTRC